MCAKMKHMVLLPELLKIVHEFATDLPVGMRLCQAALLLENFYSDLYGPDCEDLRVRLRLTITRYWAHKLAQVYTAVRDLHPHTILLKTELVGHIKAWAGGTGWNPKSVWQKTREHRRLGNTTVRAILPKTDWI